MVDALFNQPGYLSAKKVLDATVLRHQAIAANVANLERPGYRRVDLAPSFTAELQRAYASGDSRQVASLNPVIVPDASAVANSKDGNTVNLEREMMEMTQNTLTNGLETQIINGSLARLRMAVTGKSA